MYSIVKEQPAQSAFLPRVGRVALNENPAEMRPSRGDASTFLVDAADFLAPLLISLIILGGEVNAQWAVPVWFQNNSLHCRVGL